MTTEPFPRSSLYHSQRILSLLWLWGSVPAVVLMLVRTLTGGSYQAMWEWFLPILMPTLLLIVGTRAAIALHRVNARKSVDASFFKLTMWISGFYLLLVNVIVAAEPHLTEPAIEVVRQCSLFMGPVQGLVAACLGVFFASNK